MNRAAVGVVGASGYSGLEATRLLASHPGVEVRFLTSDRWGQERVSSRLDLEGPVGALRYVANDEGVAQARACDAVLLCTPAEASLQLVRSLAGKGPRLIDLSGAFRLKDPAQYPVWYGFEHPSPELLGEAVYGLPELFRERLRGARLVANPGCYATATLLSLAPLVRDGLVDPGALVVNAASGVTGAGRKATEDYSFTEIEGDFRAYRVLRHQHTPEILQALNQSGPKVGAGGLTFTPHLLPLKRGILCTTWARLLPGATLAKAKECLASAYGEEPLVTLLASAEQVSLKRAVGSPRCFLGLSGDSERLVIAAAIDNLVKGAAGQAVQNLNLALGFEETLGLSTLRSFHP